VSQSRTTAGENNAELNRSFAMLSRMMRQGRSFSSHERNCCFLNTGAAANGGPQPVGVARFANISAVSGLDNLDDGRAAALVDWDHDGDLDLWVSNRNAPRLRLMRNDTPPGNHFLAVRLVGNGTTTNRDGIGARVEVVTSGPDGKPLIKTLHAGEGFLAQSSKWLHFGLGAADKVEKIIVRWPSSKEGEQVEEFTDVEADRFYELVQGAGEARVRTWDTAQLALRPSAPQLPQQSGRARIPLVTLLALPALPFQDQTGEERVIRIGEGKPVLINLWASWCLPCLGELTEITNRADEIHAAGIDVIALSVDGLGDERADPDAAKAALARIGFPCISGRAPARLVQSLQSMHDMLLPLDRPLPVPSSFLIDGEGHLIVIYKGPLSADDLLHDVNHSQAPREDRLERSAPLAGRAIRHPQMQRSMNGVESRLKFYFATVMEDANLLQAAASNYYDVLTIDPSSPKTHFNLGNVQAKRGFFEAAVAHYRHVLSADPKFVPALKGLGDCYMRGGRLPQAMDYYQQVLALKPDDADVLTNMGTVLAGQGKVEEAIAQFNRALTVDPKSAEAHYNLGAMLLNQGKLEEAAAELKQVIEINPKYAGVHYAIATLLERAGDIAQAAAFYDAELRNNPQSADAHDRLGMLWESQGKLPQAAAHYQRAAEIDPKRTESQNNLRRVLAKMAEEK
jgi:tetratricopeptide (TPR) repeat protein/thiol-disulfide isomerase/thioredoxin